MFLAQFLNHLGQKRIGRQLVHLVGAVKEDVRKLPLHSWRTAGLFSQRGTIFGSGTA